MKAIINGRIILENDEIQNGFIVFDEKIFEIGKMCVYDESGYELDEIIDAGGDLVCPGFIDVHVHGAGGSDTMDGSIDALESLGKTIIKSGVTRYLATTMTMPFSDIKSVLELIRQKMKCQKEQKISQIMGVHLEGPFINPEKKGAQNSKYIIPPNFELIKDDLDIIKIITIAPEVDGAFEFIDKMKLYPDVKLAIGHTCSDFDTAMKAYKMGVTHITHCFNAMPPLHHREPGVLGAMLSEAFSAELIADEIHVHKGLFKGLKRCLERDKLVLITDSMRAGGLDDGEYDLGGQQVSVKAGACRLSDGTLAGSVLKMNDAISNFYKNSNIKLYEAIAPAALNPAKLLGIDNICGSLEIGKLADINIMSNDFEIIRTFVQGK